MTHSNRRPTSPSPSSPPPSPPPSPPQSTQTLSSPPPRYHTQRTLASREDTSLRLRDSTPDQKRWSRDSEPDSDYTLVATPSSPMSFLYPPRSDSYNPPRPLIDYVTNEWSHKRGSSYDSEASYFNEKEPRSFLAGMQVPRRVQRYIGGYILFLGLIWWGWTAWLHPAWRHEKLLDDSAAMVRKGPGFGVNMRPEFEGMVQMKDMDKALLPSGDGRLVFMGDVHGCRDEFQQLIEKLSFDKAKDHLILTGDLIAKGPDSSGSVDLAMSLGASCVRGNWEDRTLLAQTSLISRVHPLPGPAEDPTTREDFLDEESFSHGDYKDRALAKLLNHEQVKWLKACPVILRVGRVKGWNAGSEVVVVHAGLVPGVGLDRQDPFQVMNMRTIDLDTRVPSEMRNGEPWEKLWNHHQSHAAKKDERITVVYGHDSKRGLNIQKWSKGLDSGCLKGGSLSALVVDANGRQKVVSVDCKRYKD